MGDEILYDPIQEIGEIRNQLAYLKRVGFLFGAGASKALGLPDINKLTKNVKDNLEKKHQNVLEKVRKTINIVGEINIEHILNQVRLIRQVTGDSKDKSFESVSGENAKDLDVEICKKIYEIIVGKEGGVDLSHTKKLVTWLNWLSRDYPKEIFTTNYDLIFEKAMEELNIPYFDGFIGANNPFFFSESLDSKSKYDIPPVSWIRLWKLHGSIGWFWNKTDTGKYSKIIRRGVELKELDGKNELVIYPSQEKYESSRKQPFVAYFDRLRGFLQDGEGLFLISGYSFSDDHINAVIFDALKQNNRLHIIGFFFNDADVKKINDLGISCMNFTAVSPKTAIIKGVLGVWKKIKSDPLLERFWDEKKEQLILGDFIELVKYLLAISGNQGKIEEVVEECDEK